MFTLYGSYTSPYVRRVRIVALELGVPFEQVDTGPLNADGQAQLRTLSPIWKVPAARVDGQLLFDSHLITELLLQRHNDGGALAPFPVDDVAARNQQLVVDAALDSLINVFLQKRDAPDLPEPPYLQKQRDRAEASMRWLEQQVADGALAADGPLGLPAIALGTTVDWMGFRETYPIDRHPGLVSFAAALAKRPSFASTQPAA